MVDDPQMPRTPSVDEGHSLAADAWKRLRKNRMALGSCLFVIATAVAGYSSPLIASHGTHFSLDEMHSRLSFQPPGTADISFDHPTYDGDPSAFAAMDLDGDGRIACRRIPAKQVVHPGLITLRQWSPTLHTRAMEGLARLDQVLPASSILQHVIGQLSCPELDELNRLARHFDFLFDNYDTATGDAAPVVGEHQPDGFVTWNEFPQRDADLGRPMRNRGLAGGDAYRALDVDGDGIISRWEVTERTRYMRWNDTAKANLLAEYDTDRDFVITPAEHPGAPVLRVFWAGTDGHGRDVLTRMFYGARISISIGLMATLIALIVGVIYGSIAGFYGGRIDNIMMRIVDVLYGLPYIIIVIVLLVIVGRGTFILFIALGAVGWLSMARVIRGQVISLKTREFIEAARAVGVRKMSIIFRHLIRNTIGPVIIYSTLLVPGFMLLEAFLSFLGLGVQPPNPSWGNMITEGASKLDTAAWLILWPGTALALTLFAMNFLGDGVRDALDPKMQKD